MAKADYLSGAAASRRCTEQGIPTSTKTINKLGRDGVLPRLSDKRFDWRKIEPILRSRFEDRQREGLGSAVVPGAIQPYSPTEAPAFAAVGPDGLSEDEMYRRGRAMETFAKGELKMLELEEKRGTLVALDDVQSDAVAFAAILRGRLLQIGARCAPLVGRKSEPEIKELIDDEVNAALEALHKVEYINDAEQSG